MNELQHSTALITGASSGLGVEFARQLASRGNDLVLVARREVRLEETASLIRSEYGVEVAILPADLSKIEAVERVISVINNSSNLNILVNNAGFGIFHKFINASRSMELELLHVHMIAPVMLCRAALPGMVSRNKGTIINVSSMAGIIPIRSVLYGSSKTFLINFSEALHNELQGSGIQIQALCPGFIITEFHDTIEYSRFSRDSIPKFLWQTTEKVVSESLESLESKEAVICIPGNFYRYVGAFASNSATAGLIKLIARYVLRRRK